MPSISETNPGTNPLARARHRILAGLSGVAGDSLFNYFRHRVEVHWRGAAFVVGAERARTRDFPVPARRARAASTESARSGAAGIAWRTPGRKGGGRSEAEINKTEGNERERKRESEKGKEKKGKKRNTSRVYERRMEGRRWNREAWDKTGRRRRGRGWTTGRLGACARVARGRETEYPLPWPPSSVRLSASSLSYLVARERLPRPSLVLSPPPHLWTPLSFLLLDPLLLPLPPLQLLLAASSSSTSSSSPWLTPRPPSPLPLAIPCSSELVDLAPRSIHLHRASGPLSLSLSPSQFPCVGTRRSRERFEDTLLSVSLDTRNLRAANSPPATLSGGTGTRGDISVVREATEDRHPGVRAIGDEV